MKIQHSVFLTVEEHDSICVTDHKVYIHIHAGCRDGFTLQLTREQAKGLITDLLPILDYKLTLT